MPGDALANAILMLHALVVLFNVGSLPLIWIGCLRHWKFVRNFYFRLIHLLLIGFVAAESVFGLVCPLTTYEGALRQSSGSASRYAEGFIAYWLHQILFWDLEEKYFTIAYVGFFLLVLLTLVGVKPTPPRFFLRK